jgi:hypothetical protein
MTRHVWVVKATWSQDPAERETMAGATKQAGVAPGRWFGRLRPKDLRPKENEKEPQGSTSTVLPTPWEEGGMIAAPDAPRPTEHVGPDAKGIQDSS